MKKTVLSLLLAILLLLGLWRISNSRNFQFMGEIIPRVQTTDSLIALTFDDGPTPAYTDEVLSILNQNDVRATFFLTGMQIEQNPGETQKIVHAGHQVGNHSYSHQPMLLRAPFFLQDEIDRTDQAIRKAGYHGEIHFRPPYSKKLFLLPWLLDRMNRITITWNIEPESYAEVRNNAQNIAAHIEQKAEPGSIILLHVMYDSGEQSRRSLPIFIKNLKNKGYRFVTIDELMEKKQAGTY